MDKERLKDAVGPGRRFPFGLPRTDNANYLWIQLFYSALNEKGRAGFVMANSASDARSSEQEIRKQLIEARAVDVDGRRRPEHVLHRHAALHAVVPRPGQDRRRRAPTQCSSSTPATSTGRSTAPTATGRQAQIGFLANVVRLYRGEELDFTLGGDEAEAKLKEVFGKKPKYADVPGLCKAATLKEIEAQGWSLNPGRYVGVAPGEDVSDEDFKEQLETLNEELEALNAQARELEQTIASNVAEILEA